MLQFSYLHQHNYINKRSIRPVSLFPCLLLVSSPQAVKYTA